MYDKKNQAIHAVLKVDFEKVVKSLFHLDM